MGSEPEGELPKQSDNLITLPVRYREWTHGLRGLSPPVNLDRSRHAATWTRLAKLLFRFTSGVVGNQAVGSDFRSCIAGCPP